MTGQTMRLSPSFWSEPRRLPLQLIAFEVATILIIPTRTFPASPPAPLAGSPDGRPFVYRIVEELPPGTIVGDIKDNPEIRTSYTENVLRQLQFSFRQSGSAYQNFFIDHLTGMIKTSKRIDRDLLCPRQIDCSLVLDIIVHPGHYFRIIRVLINVEDVNDNSPSFARANFSLHVNENVPIGMHFALPQAQDADSGGFGVQSYVAVHSTVDSEAKFRLNVTQLEDGSKTVWLVLRDRLDRESCDSYAITVLASDKGNPPKSASMLVGISVGDANDNSPTFDQTTYDVTLSERRTPNQTPLTTVHASDPDADRNGRVRYSFADYTEADYGQTFSIDSTSGDIFLQKSLDYERQRAYVLAVVANDLGPGPLSSFAKVNVVIVDDNDNPPRVTLNPLSESGLVAIPENSEAGTPIAHVIVEDDDTGKNAEVECSVVEEQWFSLQKSRGENEYQLVTSRAFDREEESQYVVTVTCRDRGQPPLAVSMAVEVTILDENDNAPIIVQGDPLVFHVEENNRAGAEIGRVEATDRDTGLNSQLRYNLTSDDLRLTSLLTLNQMTGHIRVNRALNFEVQSDYTFHLTVSDLGDPPQTTRATLVLQMIDANDEYPRFEKPAYYFIVLESLQLGSLIGTLKASDGDSSQRFSQILYRLVDSSLPFQIDPDTGALSVVRKLDREETSSYRFVAIAQNPEPFSHVRATVNVTVYVDDDNDNAPVIRFPVKGNNVVYIPSNARNGSLVSRVDAWDPDEGRNAKLSYAISHGNEDFLFHIDNETGAIVTNHRRADRDAYALVVVVSDGGNPALHSVGDLLIKINRSAVDNGQGQSSIFAQQEAGAGKLDDKMLLIIGMLVAFFVIMLVIGLSLLITLLRQRRDRRKRKGRVITEADLLPTTNELELGCSAIDADLDKYSGSHGSTRVAVSHERCSNSECPFSPKTENELPIITGNERKRHQDGENDCERKSTDNSKLNNQKPKDASKGRLSCDDIVRSRASQINRPIRILQETRHIVPVSKSCDFLGSNPIRYMNEQIEMRAMALNTDGRRMESYDYSDCSDSCIDSGLDPNEDCDHATIAAMTESCVSYLPVN